MLKSSIFQFWSRIADVIEGNGQAVIEAAAVFTALDEFGCRMPERENKILCDGLGCQSVCY